jgi:helicase
LRGVGRVRARVLFDRGLKTLNDIREAEVTALARLPKIGEALAKNMKVQVGDAPTRITKMEREVETADATETGQRRLTDF